MGTGFERFLLIKNSSFTEILIKELSKTYDCYSEKGKAYVKTISEITRYDDTRDDYTLLYEGKPVLINICQNLNGTFIYSSITDDGYTIVITHN